MRRACAAVLLLAIAVPAGFAAQAPERVVDVRGMTAAPAASFEALWAAYVKADRSGDAENSRRAFSEIRRLRIERNVASLEPLGLALVEQGMDRLEKGERERAEESFRIASGLAPTLPDAQFGLALTELKKGPFGIVPAIHRTLSGVFARLPTARGSYNAFVLLVPVLLLALFGTTVALAFALVARRGALLRHDLAESLGPGRSGAVALAFYVVLLLLPVATFQGYGWLPLWWLAILFVYLDRVEKATVLGLLVLSLGVVPLVRTLEARMQAARNPLLWAGVQAVEGASDGRSLALMQAATQGDPSDKDLAYLLAALYRKAGRSDEAAGVYRGLLQADPADVIAKNNLANLEFARGEFPSAIARYKQGTEAGGPPATLATFHYNQSLAHLQRFEYQPAQEAKSNADRLARGLISEYDRRWKYDKGDYAVVDLGLSIEQVWEKFMGAAEGVAVKNVVEKGAPRTAPGGLPASLLNRFTGFFAVFAAVVGAVSLWRRRMLTLRCLKCGMIFDARDHRGGAAVGLCPQCYHLFIVRDGVSAPARNRKLLEVQGWDEHRSRLFRLFSVLSPGAGHAYAGKTLLGLALTLLWYLVIATAALAGRLLPVTEASSAISRPWGLGLAAVLLLVLWVAANRLRPELEVVVQVKRAQPPRRVRTA
ncbi:MAG TPA: tetratricopeptide repeat protein [Vicinamibacteria bacterium]|nr:tetratricopeptide repeat protein [Vicinamibacteria bacterium]